MNNETAIEIAHYRLAICTSATKLRIPPHAKCHVCSEVLEPMDQLVAIAVNDSDPPPKTPENYRNFAYTFTHSICWYKRIIFHIRSTTDSCPPLCWKIYEERDHVNAWPFTAHGYTIWRETRYQIVALSPGPIRYIFDRAGLIPMVSGDNQSIAAVTDQAKELESWI